MCERRRSPRFDCRAVALFAICRKTGKLVIGIRRRSIFLLMARKTVERHIDELRFVLHLMAVIATDVLVSADQRKSCGLVQRGYARDVLP